jgi:Protein of unknown function (DUF3301)
MYEVLFLLLAALATLVLWRASMRAREAAVAAGRRSCSEHGVQFLDDTVALRALRLLPRGAPGRRVERVYGFEFSRDGTSRESGSVTVLGAHVVRVWVGPVVELLDDSQ